MVCLDHEANHHEVCQQNQPTSCITGDADTRISNAELAILRPHLQNTFQLSDTLTLTLFLQIGKIADAVYGVWAKYRLQVTGKGK